VGVDGVGALAGVRVVVTRPAERAGGFVARLENTGAAVIKLPTIAIADPDSWAPVDAAIARLASGAYLWVMFTSRIGAERFLERVARHAAGDALDSALVGAVGPGTARFLEEAGVKVSLVPEPFTAAALASEIGPAPGPAGPQDKAAPGSAGPENRSGPGSAGPQDKADPGSAGPENRSGPGSAGAQDKAEPGRVLLPRAAETPPDMRAVLTGAGWSVDEVTVYRTVPAGEGPAAAAVRAGDFDVVTFTSGSAARAFVGLVGKPAELGLAPGGDDSSLRSRPGGDDSSLRSRPGGPDSALRSRPGGPAHKIVACIGHVTAAVAADLGFRVDVVAEEHTTEGLVAALAGMGT